VGWDLLVERSRRSRRILATLPFSLAVLHLIWRRASYGVWLPNTYYAKVVGAWPASGARYLLSFAIENVS
jgi:arabinofuranosyltransferase